MAATISFVLEPPPGLRRDLLQRAEAGPKGSAQILKDPASGEFFRLAEVEAFITQQLDGHT